MRRLSSILAATALVLSPISASAAGSAHDPIRASAQLKRPNAFSGDTTPVFIGLILIVLFMAVVVSDNRDEPNNPTSP